jgi:hypothetical protein
MAKSRLHGLDALLQKQALETANSRAARDERRAANSDRTPKIYRLGPENPDGSMAIDVADRGSDNWRQREMCPNPERAKRRLQELNAGEK